MRTTPQPRSVLLDMGSPLVINKNQTVLKESDLQPMEREITPEPKLPLQPEVPVILEHINPLEPPIISTPELQEDHPHEDPAFTANQLDPTPEEPIPRRSGRIHRKPPYLQNFVTYSLQNNFGS